jgi:hypothetical protein
MNVTPQASAHATSGASGNSKYAPIQLVLSVVTPARFSNAWQTRPLLSRSATKNALAFSLPG